MKKTLLLIIIPFINFAQISVTNEAPFNTEEYLINNVLLGDNFNTSNFSSIGMDNSIGHFNGSNSNIGFNEGVVLCTGGLTVLSDESDLTMGGSGVSGEPDLELALNNINLNWDVNNVTTIEFDFIADAETIKFQYVFSSIEYTAYTCTVFTDIFGFFLSGPGIDGTYSNNAVNIALVPDPNNPDEFTYTPVAVNTINSGELVDDPECNDIDPNFEDYNIFWIDNDYEDGNWQGVNEPPSPEFTVPNMTGFTVPLVARYDGLICGETYHIKLAIADLSDGALSSAVFVDYNSFQGISFCPATEGCLDGGACNYNSTATFHDESFCNYPGDECVVTTDLNGDSIYGFYDENCECMPHDVFVQEQITSKKLIKAMNVLGQENTLNRFRIEIYDDGSVQKKYQFK